MKKLQNNFFCNATTFVVLLLGLSMSFAQTSGIKISWNKEVGCQTYSQTENHDDPKDPLFLEDISDTDCVKVCEQSLVTYTLTNLPIGSITTWSVVGGTINGVPTNTSCKILWGNTGNGNLVFNINTPTSTLTKTICIEKITLPIASFTIQPQNQNGENYLYGCLNQTIFFSNLSTSNNGSDLVSYHWDFGDGTESLPSTSVAFQPSHIYTTEGTYNVVLTITNSCNCSTTINKEILIKGEGFDISCPSIVCEGEKQIYSLPFEGMEICKGSFNWSVIGGHIVSEAGGNVEILWDNVDASGFGYLTFDPNGCDLPCLIPSTTKIPVIQSQGTIVGDIEVCMENQGRYTLPQWPTTDFQWEIVGNVANNLADVILTDQRNEVIITPHVEGTLTLKASYMNTLLECGGTAEFTINVTKPFNFYGENIICQGTNSSFFTELGNETNWTLTNAAGNVVSTLSNSAEFNFTYNVAGNYSIVAGNASASACPYMQKNISVIALPAAPTAISGEQIICPDAPYVYSVANPDPNANYIWTVTNGLLQGSNIGNQVTVIFNNNSNPYAISVVKQTINPVICNSVPLNVSITKKIIPVDIKTASNTAVINVCANNASQYKAFNTVTNSAYNEGETYTWSIFPSTAGSITSGQGTNTVGVLWNNTTAIVNATLQLVVKKCTITSTFSKVLQILPQPNIIINSNASVCSGTPISFTISCTNGVPLTNAVVTWNFNGNIVTGALGALSASYTFTNITNANNGVVVSAYVSGASGCTGNSNVVTKNVTITPAPPASLSITSATGNTFCTASQINATLTASSTTGVTYQWFKNGLSISGSGTTLVVGPTLGFGSYTVKITNSNGCSTLSNAILIIQNCAISPPGSCVFNPEPLVQNNASNNCGTITLASTASPAPISSSWDIYGPVNFLGYTGASITPNRAGAYTIFYKAGYTCTNGTSAVKTAQKNVTIPYVADFVYKTNCLTVTFTDKSEFFAAVPVATRVVTYSYKLSSSATFINIVGSSITLPSAGTYDFKVTVSGALAGVAQPTCTKTYTNVSINSVGNKTINLVNEIKCHDTPVTFSLSNFNQATETVVWQLDNASVTSTVNTPTRVFDTPGNYTIIATVTNSVGCSRVFTRNITIPPACFSGTLVANPVSVCQGQSVTITYNAPTTNNCAVNQFVWMNGTTPITPAVNSNTLTVTTPGFYWLTVRSANDCRYDTPNRITPIFRTPPSVKLKAESTICEFGTLSVQAITTATQIIWYVNNSQQAQYNNQTQFNTNGLAVGTHTISCTVTQNGCSSTATHTVTVYAAPDIPVVSYSLVSCNPYTYQLTALLAGNATFNWSNGQPSTVTFAGGLSTSTLYVTEGGPFSVTATVGSCSTTAQLDVPKNPEMYLWIFPSGCFSNCETDVANLIGPRAPFKYWAWSFENTVEASGNGTVVAPYQIHHSGMYNLTLATNECEVTAAPLHYTQQACDECKLIKGTDIRVNNENENTPYCDFNINLTIASAYTTTQNFVLISPNQNFIVLPASLSVLPGTENYMVQIIPLNGFSGTTQLILETTIDGKVCQTILTFDIPACAVNKTKNPNAIEEVISNQIVLYPNPVKELATLKFATKLENATVSVYTILGTKMHTFTTTNETIYTIDTSKFSIGLYIVAVETADGIIQQYKLIKE